MLKITQFYSKILQAQKIWNFLEKIKVHVNLNWPEVLENENYSKVLILGGKSLGE